MKYVLKALVAFPFGILWAAVCVLGVVLLAIPQVAVNAYGKEVDWIGSFMDFMEEFFDNFREL